MASPVNDRTPPHNDEAEQAVLGGLLLSQGDAEIFEQVTAIVTGADFYKPKHACIFRKMIEMQGTGQAIDPILLAEAFEPSELNRLGGIVYFSTLMEAVPTAANATYYARIVADKAAGRRTIEAGTKIVQLGAEGVKSGETPGDLTDRVMSVMTDLGADSPSASDLVHISDAVGDAMDEIERIQEHGVASGISTGFRDLDDILHGLLPGQLIIVAGRPGIGKSTAVCDFARAAALKHNVPSAIFSLEMTLTEIVMRILSAESRVDLEKMKSGKLDEHDWVKLARSAGAISEKPLFIDASDRMSLHEIYSKTRKAKVKHNLRLVAVDYLQLMKPADGVRGRSRQDEVAEDSKGLKGMAKKMWVSVVAAAQLNRGPEQRADKRPQLSDLRESGSIEQDADVVILLHREDYYDKESPRAGEADFIVAKHRNGRTDTVTVAAQLHLSRFYDMAFTP